MDYKHFFNPSFLTKRIAAEAENVVIILEGAQIASFLAREGDWSREFSTWTIIDQSASLA